MGSAPAIRLQIESALAHKVPSALTPRPRMVHPVAATGIESLDMLLEGGLPVGAVSELTGPECSGRTSIALSFLAHVTSSGKVCAWIDATDALDPCAVAAAGVDLARLLWVRCGVVSTVDEQTDPGFVLPEKYLVPREPKKGLHGGGFGSHPRGETRDMPQALPSLLQSGQNTPLRKAPLPPQHSQSLSSNNTSPQSKTPLRTPRKPWPRIEQALRSTDLLLQGGGFSAIVLDLAGLSPETVSRIPLATWFRYRAAAMRTQSSILLLTQHACARSSAELVLSLQPAEALYEETTLFTGIRPQIEVTRRRFAPDTPHAQARVVPMRKPVQSAHTASWHSRTAWAGKR